MTRSFFCSRCPHCQTQSQIEVTSMGQNVRCPHCSQSFPARDRDNFSAALLDPIQYWIKYTEHHWNDDWETSHHAQEPPRPPR